MKILPIFCAGFLSSVALAVSADVASAKDNNDIGSKSIAFKLAPDNPNAEKACTGGGGKVSTDNAGSKICTKPVQIAFPD